MIRLVTYSDDNMSISRKKCIESAYRHGIDNVHEWDSDIMEQTEFYQLNQDIFQQGARGAGCFWLFKPYIIYKALLDMDETDILIYSDAGVEFINNVSHIIDKMDEDLFLFGNNYNHVDWCKMDVIKTINANNYYWAILEEDHLKQIQASVIFIRPTQKAKEFIKEWLLYCQMPNMIDDSKSAEPNYKDFQEHRHDQAILTCLQIKHGYTLHYWPAQYNNGVFKYDKIEQYKNDNYPIIFHHHRKRNNEF